MSIRNSILLASFLASLLIETGCKKTLDINQSPNTPSVSQGTPKLVFPAAVVGTVARVGGDLAILGAIWGEYATQSALSSQYRQLDAYNVDGSQLNGPYTGLFSSGLKNYQFIIDKSKETKDWNFYLMATVMKAYTMQVLVDLYDKVPYFEALQGTANLNPAFDDGYTIYTDLLKSIDTALSKDFSASTNTSPGKVDLIFPGVGNTDVAAEIDWANSGNINKWKQFANTLKLKIYLRMVKAKASEAQAGIQKLYADNAQFLTGNAGVFGFTDIAGKDNPMYEQNIRQLNTPDNLRASKTLASFLQTKSDTRITYYFGTASPVSIHQGDFLSTDPTYGSAARLVQRPTDPVIFISTAESYFLQAEARERYFGGAGAKALYDAGVLAAFTSMGQNGASYIASGGVYEYPIAGSLEQKIEAIIVQKWIALGYGVHYIEAFFERNRAGYPKTSPVYSTNASYVPGQFVVSKNSVLAPGLFPKRLVFPDVEKTRNSNTPEIVPIATPVWWAL
jgi:hypothetical protein